MIVVTKIKKISMSVMGLKSKDRKSTRDNFTWTLSIIYFTEGLPCWGIQSSVVFFYLYLDYGDVSIVEFHGHEHYLL